MMDLLISLWETEFSKLHSVAGHILEWFQI